MPQKSKNKTLGIRLNNPGNIRYNAHNRFIGLVGQENGFCKFESSLYGLRALCVVLRNYMRRNIRTIPAIINRYAPASDGNNVASYIDYVCKRVGKSIDPEHNEPFGRDVPLYWQSTTFLYLIQAMAYYESLSEFTLEEVKEAFDIMDCYAL